VKRPTREQVAAAAGGSVPDVIGPGLRVLFVGINPSLYSAAVGHHFARPGNRFWKTLHAAGFTRGVLSPFDDRRLLALGLGVTNLVRRATRSASELSPEELARGARRLRAKIRRQRPAFVAFLGLSAYRVALGRPAATVGPQPESTEGAQVWVLPNPSGLNARYQLPELGRLYAALRRAAGPGHPIGEGMDRPLTSGTPSNARRAPSRWA
jgi:TDG/mug DNA glycosylase family protein